MTALYALYGLNIASDFDLDLPAAAPGSIDIHIRRAGNDPPGRRLNAPMGEAWLDPATATVHFRPAPHASGEAIRLYILNALLLEMLPLLGYVCLHGSAATHNGQTLAVLAPQGTGKSTLIATLVSHGWTLLSDDILVIGDDLAIRPGIPQIRLWRDAIERLRWNERPRRPDPYRPGKFALEVPVAAAARSPSLILALQRGGEISLHRLGAAEAFFTLLENSFPLKVREARSEAVRFRILSAVSRRIPVHRQSLSHATPPGETLDAILQRLDLPPEKDDPRQSGGHRIEIASPQGDGGGGAG